MIISHKNKFIFFACGKTGSTSIENVLSKYHDGTSVINNIENELARLRRTHSRPYNLKHVRPALLKKQFTNEEWKSYFKFSFVRNPWDWVLSNFFYNFPYLGQTLYRFKMEHFDAIWYFLRIHNQCLYSDSYFQSDFVYDQEGASLVDFVGRYETLQDDFNKVCQILKIEPENLLRLNSSRHLPYKSIYTPETIEAVKIRFSKDIDLLGYTY